MAMSDELARLADLHQRGALSDDEYARAKARVLNDATPPYRSEAPVLAAINRLRRSRDDAWLGGVCGGIARITGVATWAWRLLFTLLVLCGGTGLLAYVLMWILVPREERPFDATPRTAEPSH
jgi:phage shock protein PspC (stress-responsive transcriptional regulator)